VGEHHEEQADQDQVEHEPGDQESTPPGAQPVGRQAVTGYYKVATDTFYHYNFTRPPLKVHKIEIFLASILKFVLFLY
jgi:hypothetical protein